MFEVLLAAIVAGAIILVGRTALQMKREVLTVQKHTTARFFDLASELIDSGDLSDAHLERIAQLASTITSRRFQLRMMGTITELSWIRKNGREGPSSPDSLRVALPHHLQNKWASLMFDWIVAVSAQGSVLGFGTLDRFLKYVDEPKETVVREAEAFANNAFAH